MPRLIEPAFAGGVFAVVPQPVVDARAGLRLRPRPRRDDDTPAARAAYDDPDIRRRCGGGVAPSALAAPSGRAPGRATFHRPELEHSTVEAASGRVGGKARFAREGVRRPSVRHEDGCRGVRRHSRPRGDAEVAAA